MALTYRSPIADVITNFDPSINSIIATTAAEHYKKLEEENFTLFNYAMSPQTTQHLIGAGIYLSPFSGVPHSHPACKTLENYILYIVLPQYLDNSFYFVGIKDFKLNALKARHKHTNMVQCINRYVTSQDKLRYPSDFVVRHSKPHAGLSRHRMSLEGHTLRDLVPELMVKSCKKLFLHDELHYWKIDELCTFLEVVQPQVVLGTIVYPPELLKGSKKSLNNWCYTYEVKGRALRFYPDGVRAEGYEQPLNGGFLLECGRIKLCDGTIYMVDILSSKFAHHLISITRGEAAGPTMRSYGPFEATACNGLDPLVRDVSCSFPISYEVVSKLYRYLKTLRKPDEQSSMAKLTQLLPCPSGEEIVFEQEFSKLVISTNTIRTMISADRLKIFMGKYLSRLPKVIADKFETVKEISLHEFIKNLEPFTVDVVLKEIKWNNVWTLELKDDGMADDLLDPIRLLEDKFGLGTYDAVPDRKSAGYYMTRDKLKGLGGPLIEIDREVLKVTLASICYKSLSNSDGTLASINEIAAFFRMICARPFLRPAKRNVYDLYGPNGAIGLQAYMRSRWARYVKFYWANIGLLWFRCNNKAYQKYLTAYPNDGTTYARLMQTWKVVCAEVGQGATRLKKTDNFSWLRCGSRMEPNCAHKEEPDAPPFEDKEESPDGVNEPHFSSDPPPMYKYEEDAGAAREIKCSCGLSITIGKDLTASFHKFQTPDRLKNRNAGFYSKSGEGYVYNGGAHESLNWPKWLNSWMTLLGIPEEYNCCLVQRYDRGGGIGLHSDDEKCFVENGPVFTVNIEGESNFSIACKGAKRSDKVDFKLSPGEYFEMPRGFQRTHKHGVSETSENRLSVTFRIMKGNGASPSSYNNAEDHHEAEPGVQAGGPNEETHFEGHEAQSNSDEASQSADPESGSENVEEPKGQSESQSANKETSTNSDGFTRNFNGCKVSVCTGILSHTYNTVECGGGGNCFWLCLANEIGSEYTLSKKLALRHDLGSVGANLEALKCAGEGVYAVDEAIACAACTFKIVIRVYQPDEKITTIFEPTRSDRTLHLELKDEHFRIMRIVNGCVIRAISSALSRTECEIMHVIEENCDPTMIEDLWKGDGVDLGVFQALLELFSIKALIFENGKEVLYNREGRFGASFEIVGDHIEHTLRKKGACSRLFEECGQKVGVKAESLELLSKAGTNIRYKSTIARAKRLADSLCAGATGVVSSSLFNKKPNLAGKFRADTDVLERNVLAVIGTFGSGKSTILKNFFKINLGRKVLYVSPRKALLDEFHINVCGVARKKGPKKQCKKGQENWDFMTFESFILNCSTLPAGMAVILDEIQLYPPGYLDMLCYLLNDGVHIVVAGDPAQSDYDSEKDRVWLHGIEPDHSKLLSGQEYKYVTLSKRMQNSMFIGRLPCTFNIPKNSDADEDFEVRGGIEIIHKIEAKWKECFLVSSFEEKRLIEYYQDERGKREEKVLTFGESTGLTFNYGCILITQSSEKTNEQRWVTALSRFRKSVCFINATGMSLHELLLVYRDRALGRFLGKRADVEDLRKFLPGEPIFSQEYLPTMGAEEGVREEKLAGDPWLKTMIDLLQIEDVEEEVSVVSEIAREEWFKTHLPQEELESVRARWVHKILAKEAREVRMGDIVSEQFADEHSKEKGKQLTNAAERFEAIYPRHRSSDTVTFVMAVRKRLRFSKPLVEVPKLRAAKPYGPMLLKKFLKHVPLKPNRDPILMAQAKMEFEAKKVSKSAAIIENHSIRSTRDWLVDIGQIFSKSQICTKFEKRFCTAKAAQSIVCFQHSVLVRFAPYMRYIELKLRESLPDRYYIHSGKGLDELDHWVRNHGFDGICTESDYEAFDASQDQYIVAFELALMSYLGLPQSLIADYEYIKTHLGSKLGSFAIMRFSGEASTFLFNTMANMLFTFMRYNINNSDNICFAGDDMCASRKLPLSKEYESFLSKLKLKAKVQFTAKPTFCGWNLSPDGIYKKPQLVLERMCIARETNNLHNCIDNYAIEVSYAYKMGEKAVNRMDEEELAAYYNCVRIIIKNRHLLRSNVSEVYGNRAW
uniref:ORF1 protein n=1 Tax=Carya illinoinensis carlavirus 1 TaxID=2794420 RepID=A0A7T5QZC7_9VIRU|nr:RdRp [Carya illinoinensis carlavirus 1]